MKTKILLLSLFASVISINAFSQQLKISVNQLDAGLVYTRNQIINALGTPSEIINHPDDVFADAVTYKCGSYLIVSTDNFSLKSLTTGVPSRRSPSILTFKALILSSV